MVENKTQTVATDPEKWHDRFLYTLPNGKQTYLTKREKTIADKINSLYSEGKLSDVVSPQSLNHFFRQRYILGLEGDEAFFAKQYYKAYILDFAKFKAQQDKRKEKLQQLKPGAEEEE